MRKRERQSAREKRDEEVRNGSWGVYIVGGVLNWTNGIKVRGSRDENRWIRVDKDGRDLKVRGFRVFHRCCSFGQLRERIRSQLWVRG